MTNKEVEDFCTGIGSLVWKSNFEQFCKECGFNPDHLYAQEKWEEFKCLNKYLSKFDNELLTQLVRSGLKLPTQSIPA
ncbi:hypothetical protein CAL7716_100380 (plasmid) [Calothrix sp. PCC 7716]|nr:hypothetical protein CAL7716_100380 [Calothrix sp. PCC 7716]